MEDGGCRAEATPAVRVPLRWIEPYQLDVPGWGVVERRLREGLRGDVEEEEVKVKSIKSNLVSQGIDFPIQSL